MLNALRNLLSVDVSPNKVLEVKPDAYSDREIHFREESLILYAPVNSAKRNERAKYEILLHRPFTESYQAFSLYRTEDKDDAEVKFICFKDILPTFIEISKDMCNINGLQKVCDTLASYPTWNLAHLAVHFSLYDCLNNAKVNSYLNSSDDLKGMSPLQLTIQDQNWKMVQKLVNAKCSLEHLDHEGNSVFHYAASTTKDIILALCQGPIPRCLNARNQHGYTPLHLACLADKPDCVRALLLNGADVNITASKEEARTTATDSPTTATTTTPGYVGDFLQSNQRGARTFYQKDMKCGGTPLHWACSREVIDTLVDMNCHIDTVNFEQRTALHIMVLRNRLECVVALLARHANPNLRDQDGNTPLHLAIKQACVPIIQCLICFGADLNATNNAGETARHRVTKEQEPKLLHYLAAVGAHRCAPDMSATCTEGCRADGTYEGIPPPPVIGPPNREILNQMLVVAGMEVAAGKYGKRPPGGGRLLSLDGGGIRGLILVQMLLELERMVGEPINSCFDWVTGTSTGGILALALAAGRTMQECLCLYFRMKQLTFVGLRPYASEPLENILKETFGAETVMSDIKQPKLLITGVLADRKPVELHFFRNYTSPNDILGVRHDSPYELPDPPEEQLVWHVGRATGAAPTYFRAFGRFLDGGLIANNPTLDALTEIHEYNLALRAKGRESEVRPVTVVVSLGTGLIPVKELKDVDIFLPGKLWDTTKLVMGISSLGNLIVDQATASDGRVVDRARAWCSMLGVPYFRFSPQMSEDISLDETSDEKLCRTIWEAKAYMYSNIQTLREVADILLRR